MRKLYLLAAVTMAGVSSVFSLLAELEKRYELATRHLGWIAASAFVAALVAQLWLSRYADRGHAGLLLRVGIVASAVGLLWFAASTEVWQFVAARGLLGAGVGMIVPPARRALVVGAEGNQGERLGVFYSAYLAGFVFGPPIAGFLTEIGDVRLPFVVFGLLTASMIVPIVRLDMPEADPSTVRTDLHGRRVLRRLLRSRPMLAALLVVVSFRYSIGVFEPLWATHLDDLGASTRMISLSLSAFAFPMLIVAKQAGRLSDRVGPRLASLLAAAMTLPMMATYGYAGVFWVILIVAVPHGLMEAILSPGSQSAVALAASDDDAASAQGLAEASGSAAAAVGALTAPAVFETYGAGPAWVLAASVMAALLATSWVLDPPVRRRAVAVDEGHLRPVSRVEG